jgi:4-amino-4-deoxy-L-arabinose transferase-like glycosyltransferase
LYSLSFTKLTEKTKRNKWLVWITIPLIIAIILRLYKIGDFQNTYYTATAISMLQNWSNFFFASFDPIGIVTVDKPPISFWIQSISIKIFGITPWSASIPHMIAGILSILVLYLAIKPTFGNKIAGLTSIIAAIIPVNVLMDTRNEPDSILIFILTLCAYFLIIGIRTNKFRWIIGFALLMGIAFNTKMLVAFIPLPIFLIYYFIASPKPIKKILARIVIIIIILVVSSASWSTIVALTPPEARPYIGSTKDNSIWTLIFEYNGLNRFSQLGKSPPPYFNQPNNTRGLFGLLSNPHAAQLGWILPLGFVMTSILILSIISKSIYIKPSNFINDCRQSRKKSEVILWIGWFLSAITIFGLADATSSHPYYLIGVSIPLAATTAIGFNTLIEKFRDNHISAYILPIIIISCMFIQIWGSSTIVSNITHTITIIMTSIICLLLFNAIFQKATNTVLSNISIIVGISGLLIIPTVYSWTGGGILVGPQAGINVSPRPNINSENSVSLISEFLEKEKIINNNPVLSTMNAREASAFIISGIPAVALGGFAGKDPIFSPESLEKIASTGKIKYLVTNRNSELQSRFNRTTIPLLPLPYLRTNPNSSQLQQSQYIIRPQMQAHSNENILLQYISENWEDVSQHAHLQKGTLYKYKPKKY